MATVTTPHLIFNAEQTNVTCVFDGPGQHLTVALSDGTSVTVYRTAEGLFFQ